MEIKTLAQILEESADKPNKSGSRSRNERSKKQKQSQQNKSRQHQSKSWAERASAHGFAAPENPNDTQSFNPDDTTSSNNHFAGTAHLEQSQSRDTSNSRKARTEAFKQYKSEREDADDHLFFEKHVSASAELGSKQHRQSDNNSVNNSLEDNEKSRKKRKKKKQFHPASPYKPKIKSTEPIKEPDPNSIRSILAQVKAEQSQNTEAENSSFDDSASSNTQDANQANSLSDNWSSNQFTQVSQNEMHEDTHTVSAIDNLPAALRAYLKTPEQRQAEIEAIKANSRLRWLAFYYLSRREHSAGELRQKLIDKEQDPAKVDELLQEFAEKGYQSDYRTALMLIREGIRKGRGRLRIKNDFYKRKVALPSNIDELIDMATEDNAEFVDVVSDNELVDGVDWLRLAVEARVKKYGDEIPTDQKAKARQLRFLQYRGFKPDICFGAINHNLETLDERF